MKRYLTLFLAALMLISIAACGPANDDNKDTDEKKQSDNSGDSSADSSADSETSYWDDVLPTKDFDGAVYTWVSCNDEQFPAENSEDQEADESSLAIIKRFDRVKEKYNVTWNFINAGGSGNTVEMAQQDFMIGGGSYNVANGSFVYLAAPMVTNGLATSAQKVGTIDLSQDWWSAQAETDLAIGGNTYILTGALATAYFGNSSTMVYNKDLISKFGLDDPYTYLEGGKWTFDVWSQMATAVGSRVDNGGYWAWKEDGQSDVAYFIAAGLKLTERDSDGYLKLADSPSERMVNIIDKYNRFFKQPDKFDNGVYNWYYGIENADSADFYEGNVVFMNSAVGELVWLAQNFEGEYGIMPTPIYEEGADYLTGCSMYWTDAITLMRGAADYELTGVITEALCYVSNELLRPIEYEKAIKTRGAKDEETIEVLDIIFDNKVYDICTILYPGEAFNEFITYNVTGSGDGIASEYASKVGAAQATLNQINEYIKDIEAGK